MPLGRKVGRDPSNIVLDGDPAPPPKRGQSPQFSSHVYCGQTAAWIKMPLGMEVGHGPGHIVLNGDPACPPKNVAQPTNSSPCLLWPNGWRDQDATWYDGRHRPGQHCLRCGPAPPQGAESQSPPPKKNNSAHVCCGQTAGWIKICHLVRR